jgi:hypothetical protein
MVSKDKCMFICTVACSVVDAFINPEPGSGSGSVSGPRFFREIEKFTIENTRLIHKT